MKGSKIFISWGDHDLTENIIHLVLARIQGAPPGVKGLSHMFQMMNSARINTGVSGMSIAGTAYLNALAYTTQRRQGRGITGNKTDDVTLIEHPDIRRMLLWMKHCRERMRAWRHV